MDYHSISTMLMFSECETQQCTVISVVDDFVLENNEVFNVTLERTPGLDGRIGMDMTEAVIEISDNDNGM